LHLLHERAVLATPSLAEDPSMFAHSLAAAAAASLLGFTISLAPLTETYSGKIAAVTEKGLTVVVRQGDNVAFLVAPECAITLDGKPVALQMLAVGHSVKISAVEQGTDHVAKRIDARSSE
jgi:hypothetical protein